MAKFTLNKISDEKFSYRLIGWKANETPLSATNMNHIEDGISTLNNNIVNVLVKNLNDNFEAIHDEFDRINKSTVSEIQTTDKLDTQKINDFKKWADGKTIWQVLCELYTFGGINSNDGIGSIVPEGVKLLADENDQVLVDEESGAYITDEETKPNSTQM